MRKQEQDNEKKDLPAITRGGNIIVQNWNSKTQIPADVENVNLPIILNRNKILSLGDGENEKKETEQL